MRYKLAIFDMDGTVLNTLDDLADSTNHALESCGLPKRTKDEVRRFVGNGIRLLIERAVPAGTSSELIDKVFAEFKAYYALHCADKTCAYDGIVDALKELKSKGYKLALVSNKVDFAVQELCKDYFPNIFDIAVGEREGMRKKPAPDSVLEVLRVLDIEKNDAVYIGDSDVDYETSVNSGIDDISVTWGFRDKEFMMEKGATVFVDSPDELVKLLCS